MRHGGRSGGGIREDDDANTYLSNLRWFIHRLQAGYREKFLECAARDRPALEAVELASSSGAVLSRRASTSALSGLIYIYMLTSDEHQTQRQATKGGLVVGHSESVALYKAWWPLIRP